MKDLLFSIPEVACDCCDEIIDPEEAIIMVIMICPKCHKEQAFEEAEHEYIQ